jgi:hypothetical protein
MPTDSPGTTVLQLLRAACRTVLFAGSSLTRLPRCGAGHPCEDLCRTLPLQRRCITCSTGIKQQAASLLQKALLCRRFTAVNRRSTAGVQLLLLAAGLLLTTLLCCHSCSVWDVKGVRSLLQSIQLCNRQEHKPHCWLCCVGPCRTNGDHRKHVETICYSGHPHRVVVYVDDSICQQQWSHFT